MKHNYLRIIYMCFDHLLQFWRNNFAVYVSLCKFLLKYLVFTEKFTQLTKKTRNRRSH